MEQEEMKGGARGRATGERPGMRGGRENHGHAPEDVHDDEFAPVLRGADAEGRTRPAHRGDTERSGTGVPNARSDHPDTLPPDTEGVEEAERDDESRPARPRRRYQSDRK